MRVACYSPRLTADACNGTSHNKAYTFFLPSFLVQAAQLAYYEALVMLYERLGRYSAAARFALAAARQVAAAMPGPEQLAARASVQGRLWASVFSCCMECGRYEVRGTVG